MRFFPAHPLRFIAISCLAVLWSGTLSADTIYLKNGRKITAANVIQENGLVSYDTSAGHLSLPASIVDHVVREAASLDSTAGTASNRAANLPIAPPSTALAPGADDAAGLAVHDGSLDLGLLATLESEATANPSPAAAMRVISAEIAAAQFEISAGDC